MTCPKGKTTDANWLEELAEKIEIGDSSLLFDEKTARLLRTFAIDLDIRQREAKKEATLDERIDGMLRFYMEDALDRHQRGDNLVYGRQIETLQTAATWLLSRRMKEAGSRSLMGGALGGLGGILSAVKGLSGFPDTIGIPKDDGFDSKPDE